MVPSTIIMLAGDSGSGKSTLAREIQRILGVERCCIVSTSAILKERWKTEGGDGPAPSPGDLREFGDSLTEHDPLWFTGNTIGIFEFVVIDAIRNINQLQGLRNLWTRGGCGPHVSIYLGKSHKVEEKLFEACDERVLTGYGDPAGQALGILERLVQQQTIDCVIGAQWGSEGKGKVAAYLASSPNGEDSYAAMGRAGSPNAGHRVELPKGGYFVFRHLPSATPYAAPGTALCIGPGAVIDLDVLRKELEHIPLGCTLYIDPRVAIADEEAKEAERDAGCDAIGSTMTGSGGALALRVLRRARVAESITASEVDNNPNVKIGNVGRILREAALRGKVLLESTQGMQLSLLHGSYPHVTGRDVSPIGLLAEMGLPASMDCRWWVVARTYPIRVAGPSGPLPNETTWEEVAHTSGIDVDTLREKERTSVTKRLRRVARWERGALIRTVRRSFSRNDEVVPVITFSDYLSASASGRADMEAIIEEARAVSFDGRVILGCGPRTSDVQWLDEPIEAVDLVRA